jgi:hypothetical protein
MHITKSIGSYKKNSFPASSQALDATAAYDVAEALTLQSSRLLPKQAYCIFKTIRNQPTPSRAELKPLLSIHTLKRIFRP